eukprot:758474-Hanusia_phi.AAC.5
MCHLHRQPEILILREEVFVLLNTILADALQDDRHVMTDFHTRNSSSLFAEHALAISLYSEQQLLISRWLLTQVTPLPNGKNSPEQCLRNISAEAERRSQEISQKHGVQVSPGPLRGL